MLDDNETPIKPDQALFAELVRGRARAIPGDRRNAWALRCGKLGPLERVELLLRCILRAGVYELLVRRAVPARVAISEYVDLADAFFDSAECGMANAILDGLARRLREAEFTQHRRRTRCRRGRRAMSSR